MKVLKEFWQEMDRSEKIEAIGSIFAWGGLFWMCFMMSAIFG